MNVSFDIAVIILSRNPKIINDSEKIIAEISNFHTGTPPQKNSYLGINDKKQASSI